jgi:hypothetical protein
MATYRARGVFVVGILIGLAIATALVIGWGCGFFVVAVFLTLGEALGFLFIMRNAEPPIFLFAAALLAAIWAPSSIRLYLGISRKF